MRRTFIYYLLMTSMTIVDYGLKFLGRPYIWGGDGSGKCGGGFDCSGLVVECLRAFGRVDCDLTAQGLYDYLVGSRLTYSFSAKAGTALLTSPLPLLLVMA